MSDTTLGNMIGELEMIEADVPHDNSQRAALERDIKYAQRCHDTFAPVLIDELSPHTRTILSNLLAGRACPDVGVGPAYYASDVIIALGRKLEGQKRPNR